MTPGKRVAAALCVAAVGISAPRASAQSASAELLFREGRTLIKSGKLAAGCDKLAASDRLEPSIGTALNLGDCREKLGQLATAWAAFRRAEAMAHRAGNDGKREAEARRRADRLESQLPSLEIDVPRPVDDLVVRRTTRWSMRPRSVRRCRSTPACTRYSRARPAGRRGRRSSGSTASACSYQRADAQARTDRDARIGAEAGDLAADRGAAAGAGRDRDR